MQSSIVTKLTKLLGIQTPIVCGTMAGGSGGALAAQISIGGGFGFVAAGYDSADKFGNELEISRSILKVDRESHLPIGVGFLCWQLDKAPSTGKKLIDIALMNHVQAIWLAFGEDLGHWVEYIRHQSSKIGKTVQVFVQITSVEEALIAINNWHADVIVVQGIEAGGHGSSNGLPVLTLLPSVIAVTPPNGPLILAAGGLATGAHVASLLTMGASGVVLGTRFLLSPESLYTDAQRHALVLATSALSVRTMAFDYARNTLGWPHGIDGRGLRNATVEDYERGVEIDVLRERFAEGVRKGDTSRTVVWAGSGVGLMNTIKPAVEIVRDLHQECMDHLSAAATLISRNGDQTYIALET